MYQPAAVESNALTYAEMPNASEILQLAPSSPAEDFGVVTALIVGAIAIAVLSGVRSGRRYAAQRRLNALRL